MNLPCPQVGGGLSSAQRSARAELQAAVATLRRLSHSLSGVSAIMTNDIGISEDMEEDEAEERADAVAQVSVRIKEGESETG